jgi:oxaloacetate decarboxylase gamma subunit
MSEIVSRGIDLAIYGMGTVFVFLTVLVGATMLMSFVLKWQAALVQEQETTVVSADKLAAISAAVRAYRDRHTS